MSPDAYSVVHSMHLWLSQTMTWLHTQVQHLPPRIDSRIVCDKVDHLDQFPAARLVSPESDGAVLRALSARFWPLARRRNAYLLSKELGLSDARVLHSHFGDRGWANLSVARRHGVRHVVTFYGYDVSRLPQAQPRWRGRYEDMFAAADLFLCEGPFMAQSLVRLGCPQAKVRVHHLGVKLDEIAYEPRSWEPGSPLKVLIAGTFTEKKGIPYALRALARVRHRVPLEIHLIGDADAKADRQAEKAQILRAIDEGELGPQVRLHGYVTHARMHEIARGCHVFLSPSVTAADGDSEGGAPVSIIEMAAAGLPVVSTRHCDIPEVIEDGVGGWLGDERDVESLERHLLWLIEHPGDWQAVTRAARRRIETEFDARSQGQRLAAHYDALAARP